MNGRRRERRRRRSCLILSLMLAAVAACDFLRDPTTVGGVPDAIVVHAVLPAGLDTARVLIQEIRPRDGTTSAPRGPLPVSDAIVTLTGPVGTNTLSEVDEAVCLTSHNPEPEERGGCYVVVIEGGIAPAAEYTLEARLPDGTVVHGSARTLALPRITAPAARSTIMTGEPFEIAVDAPGAASILARAGLLAAFHADSTLALDQLECEAGYGRIYGGEQSATTGTVPFLIEYAECRRRGEDGRVEDVAFDSMHVHINLIAYDSMYVGALRDAAGAISAADASVGLENAFGIFAGAGAAALPLTLRRPEE